MKIHTLFVCRSCSAQDHEVPEDSIEGNQLFLKLLAAHSTNPACHDDLNIEAVDCLGTCDRPCSVSLAHPHKYIYHFVDVSIEKGAADLLKVCQLYINSDDGDIEPKEMPRSIRSNILVCIPPILKTSKKRETTAIVSEAKE